MVAHFYKYNVALEVSAAVFSVITRWYSASQASEGVCRSRNLMGRSVGHCEGRRSGSSRSNGNAHLKKLYAASTCAASKGCGWDSICCSTSSPRSQDKAFRSSMHSASAVIAGGRWRVRRGLKALGKATPCSAAQLTLGGTGSSNGRRRQRRWRRGIGGVGGQRRSIGGIGIGIGVRSSGEGRRPQWQCRGAVAAAVP